MGLWHPGFYFHISIIKTTDLTNSTYCIHTRKCIVISSLMRVYLDGISLDWWTCDIVYKSSWWIEWLIFNQRMPIFEQSLQILRVNSHGTVVPKRDFVCCWKFRLIPDMWWDWTAATQISLFHPVRWDSGLWYHRTALYRREVSSDNLKKNIRGHRYVI